VSADADGPAKREAAGPGPVGTLPDVVRNRVVGLAAEALGALPVEQLPPALKRVASFAPARRARLAGSRIASVLETDDTFRERLATHVEAQLPDLAEALRQGTTPAAADPVELAAVAYVLRPEGWPAVVAGASDVVAAERSAAARKQTSDQIRRLHRQLDDAVAELRESRERHRGQVAALKAENAELRRKLGDARAGRRAADQRAEEALAAAEEATSRSSVSAATSEAELRRLRARVAELTGELTALRRAEREGRGTATLRARLLLDTVLEATQGLRRELALPAVEGSPSDAVEADLAAQGSRTPTGAGSLPQDDPRLLEQLLTLPRTHLVIDGYNVTKTAWPGSPLESQRDRLLAGLAPLAARSGAQVTVVFDAAETVSRPLVNPPRGVRVLFSPAGVIADDVIRQLVAAEPSGRSLVVVSSDREVVRDVSRSGARTAAAPALSRLLGRS